MDSLHPGDPSRVGKYRLESRLGAGGMGQVFLGLTPGGHKVVVKLIRPEHAGKQRFRERFAREVKAAKRVVGMHTAQVIDADPDADPPWMVTTYIAGPSLHQAVTERGPLGEEEVRVLGAGLAEGLAAIHACGIIHRDLKPANIIMAANGPCIIDFGIARVPDDNTMTQQGAPLGTYPYMSPEHLNGRAFTPASDVFSLGAVLAYAATGRSPFDAPSVPLIAHRINQPPDLDHVPSSSRDMIAACLAQQPHDRPAPQDLIDMLGDPGTQADTTPDRPEWAPPRPARNVTMPPAPSTSAPGGPPSQDNAPAPESRTAGAGFGGADPGAPSRGTTSPPRLTRRRVLISAAATAAVGGGTAFAAWWGEPDGALAVPDHTTAVAVGRLNGKTIAVTGSGGNDKALVVRVWDLATGKQVGPPTAIATAGPGHTLGSFVRALAVGVVHAKPVVVACTDGGVRVWDLATRRPVGRAFGSANALGWMAIGELRGKPIVAAGGEGTGSRILAWDLAGQRQLLSDGVTSPEPAVGEPSSAGAVGQINGRAVAVTAGATLQVWDLTTAEQVGGPLTGHAEGISAVAVGRLNGRTIAVTGGSDKTVRVWDLTTRKQVGAPLTGHAEGVSAVAVGELNGRTVAVTGGGDKTLRVWDLTTRQQIVPPLTVHTGPMRRLAVDRLNGRTIAVTGSGRSGDMTVRVWDLAAGKPFAFIGR
ncbi:WD40 repeat domain-containing serine/threonine protein kinase [Spirillospora sp. CA-255316]